MDDTATRRRHPKKSTNNNNGSSLHVANGNDEGVAATRKRSTKRRRKRRGAGPPFYILVLQVGITLLLICFATYRLYRWVYPQSALSGSGGGGGEEGEYADDDGSANMEENNMIDDGMQREEQEESEMDDAQKAKLNKLFEAAQEEEKEKTPPPIPHFELSEASQWDAFGVVDKLRYTTEDDNSRNFWRAAHGMRQRYAEIYGGDNAARMLLDRGLTTFAGSSNDNDVSVPDDVVATACRLQSAKIERRPFRMAFGGYSVTAGRGNKFQDSFPFQLEKYLGAVLSLAGISLVVNNAAIGGCPAFPYGFCMNNFWGEHPDVVSWDYSMNEAGGVPDGLEAYVRHMLSNYAKNPPKLIVKDTHMATQRRDVLGHYESLLRDPLVIHTDPAVQPFLDRKEDHRPVGFQEWRKFGAPPGAPGQAPHHPAVKEHEMIGWVLAMHFLTALEYLMAKGDNLSCPTSTQVNSLPPPVSGTITNTTDMEYETVLFGHHGDGDQWHMNPVHCRTTFQPILSGDMSEIVVSGTTAEDLDVLLPKSQMYYNQGWTLDLSEGEKNAKRKLSVFENSLGFLDSKEAYYGIYESPKMSLLLPLSSSTAGATVGSAAKEWFESIVLCQVNEKRDLDACNFGSDIGVVVGGANVTTTTTTTTGNVTTTVTTSQSHMMEDAGTLYLGQQMCLHVMIPEHAVLTSHNELDKQNPLDTDVVGVLLEVKVTNPHVAHIHQACSISHAIWEEKRKPKA